MGALAEEYELYGDQRFEEGQKLGCEIGIAMARAGLVEYYANATVIEPDQCMDTLEQIIDDMKVPPKQREFILMIAKEKLIAVRESVRFRSRLL